MAVPTFHPALPGFKLPPPPPLGAEGRTQSFPSVRVLGKCMFCDTDVFEYESRDAFYSTFVHWSCSKAEKQIRQALLVTGPQEDILALVPQEDQDAYLRALQSFQSPTLATMILEYETAPEEQVTPDLTWKIAIVRRLLRTRTGVSL